MPFTVALHCDVALMLTVAGLQATCTEVMVEEGGGGGGACTVTEALPDFVASCMLIAVTVTVPAEAGAVRRPLALMVPALGDHVTAEL